jgi:hypothetical protein
MAKDKVFLVLPLPGSGYNIFGLVARCGGGGAQRGFCGVAKAEVMVYNFYFISPFSAFISLQDALFSRGKTSTEEEKPEECGGGRRNNVISSVPIFPHNKS